MSPESLAGKNQLKDTVTSKDRLPITSLDLVKVYVAANALAPLSIGLINNYIYIYIIDNIDRFGEIINAAKNISESDIKWMIHSVNNIYKSHNIITRKSSPGKDQFDSSYTEKFKERVMNHFIGVREYASGLHGLLRFFGAPTIDQLADYVKRDQAKLLEFKNKAILWNSEDFRQLLKIKFQLEIETQKIENDQISQFEKNSEIARILSKEQKTFINNFRMENGLVIIDFDNLDPEYWKDRSMIDKISEVLLLPRYKL